MKATIRSTDEILHLQGVEARVWVGETEAGVPFQALITRIAVANDLGPDAHAQFARELLEVDAPRPERPAYGATPSMAQVGDVFQIDPTHDDVFGGSLLTVTEPKAWGVMGFVRMPGAGDAYYRAPWAALVYIGRAAWAPARDGAEGA